MKNSYSYKQKMGILNEIFRYKKRQHLTFELVCTHLQFLPNRKSRRVDCLSDFDSCQNFKNIVVNTGQLHG